MNIYVDPATLDYETLVKDSDALIYNADGDLTGVYLRRPESAFGPVVVDMPASGATWIACQQPERPPIDCAWHVSANCKACVIAAQAAISSGVVSEDRVAFIEAFVIKDWLHQ